MGTRRYLLVSAAVFVLSGWTLPSSWPQSTPAQVTGSASPHVPDWQRAAGGKAAFDVASIKQDISGDRPHTNVNLSGLDDVPPNGGFLSSVNFSLESFIGFAYKLTPGQVQYLQPQLPKWANAERFDVEARASGAPTRDQLRLMMQSLLADRFKLTVHFETRELPVYGLVLERPGKTGSQLIQRKDTANCSAVPAAGGAATPPRSDGWFTPCGGIGLKLDSGQVRVGSQNLTMAQLASFLPAASLETLDRPVLDQTGLSGAFDFRIEFTPEGNFPLPPGVSFTPDPAGPTFLEALKEQLGLKLVPRTGPVDVLVVDHLEEPSAN